MKDTLGLCAHPAELDAAVLATALETLARGEEKSRCFVLGKAGEHVAEHIPHHLGCFFEGLNVRKTNQKTLQTRLFG